MSERSFSSGSLIAFHTRKITIGAGVVFKRGRIAQDRLSPLLEKDLIVISHPWWRRIFLAIFDNSTTILRDWHFIAFPCEERGRERRHSFTHAFMNGGFWLWRSEDGDHDAESVPSAVYCTMQFSYKGLHILYVCKISLLEADNKTQGEKTWNITSELFT